VILNSVIGTVAKPGGGKGTFKKLLEDACRNDGYHPSVKVYKFSDPLRKTLQWFEIMESRENLQSLSTWLRTRKPESLAYALRKMIAEEEFVDIKLADGVRSLNDEKMIRSFAFGSIVYVKVDPEKRLERVRLRKENPGDAEKTMEQFLAEDAAEPERYIEDIGSRADFVIDNNGSLEDYRKQVEDFYQKILKPLRSRQD